jgi:uncharacterized protein (TIGR02466 family)
MEYRDMVDVKSHELFPTVIHEFDLRLDFYEQTNMISFIEQGREDVDLYQTCDDLQILSFFSTFRDNILSINETVLTNLGYEYEGLTITNMWGNIMRAGANHPPHTHSNNFLSGVYYLKAEGDTAPIQFFDPRVQSGVLVPRRKSNNKYNSSMMQFNSVTGKGFIFPSWLQHWVKTNKSERISVSWNIQVKGHYGELHTLQNAHI